MAKRKCKSICYMPKGRLFLYNGAAYEVIKAISASEVFTIYPKPHGDKSI